MGCDQYELRLNTMELHWSVILAVIITFQLSFVSAFLLLSTKGNLRNNRLLGLLFLLFGLGMLDFTLRIFGFRWPIAGIHWIDDGFFFLYGPVFYLYARGVTQSDFKVGFKHCLHFIPFGLFALYITSIIITVSSNVQEQLDQQLLDGIFGYAILVSFLLYGHLYLYLILSFNVFRRYKSAIRQQYSSLEKINLDWLNFMLGTLFAITSISLFHNLMPFLGQQIFHLVSLLALLLFLFYFIMRVLIKALIQPELFSGVSGNELEKYAGSNMTYDEVIEWKEKVHGFLEKDKMYLKSDLSLNDLSEFLHIPPKNLSQVINQGFGVNYFDLINSYRCDEFKRILRETSDKKMTVLEAMYKSGFSSKSSFNSSFKKITGQTPSTFKQSLK